MKPSAILSARPVSGASSMLSAMREHARRRPFVTWGASLALLSAAGISTALFASDGQPVAADAITYVAVAAVTGDDAGADGVTGEVQAAQPLDAAAAAGGRIVLLRGEVGDSVRAGQMLARIDGRAAMLRVGQADVEVRRMAAIAAEKAVAADRAEALAKIGAMSEAERAAASADAIAALGAAASASASAALARNEAALGVVRAPAAGAIAARSAQLGSVVAPGQVIFTIEGSSGRVIAAAVPQTRVGSVRLGQTVRYDADGASGTARVTGISPRVEAGGVVPVRLAIESGRPSPGSIVRVAFGGDRPAAGALRVALGAVQIDGAGRRYVYRLDARSRVVPVPVTVRGVVGGDARVVGALTPAARIVAAGGAFLRPGQRVRIARAGI